jgi:hypothetical protein
MYTNRPNSYIQLKNDKSLLTINMFVELILQTGMVQILH